MRVLTIAAALLVSGSVSAQERIGSDVPAEVRSVLITSTNLLSSLNGGNWTCDPDVDRVPGWYDCFKIEANGLHGPRYPLFAELYWQTLNGQIVANGLISSPPPSNAPLYFVACNRSGSCMWSALQ